MGTLLENGLIYSGKYQFQQVGPPTISGGGVATVSVPFAGAAPLAADFIAAVRRKSLPKIIANGALGSYASATSLVNAFDSLESDGGKIWTKVTLNFAIPATDKPTKIEEKTLDKGASLQNSTILFWPTDITLEIIYLAPTVTVRWVATTEPKEPITATPGDEMKVIRSWWHRASDGAVQSNPFDYDPPQEIRLLGWDAKEVLPGLRWECWATWGRVYLSNYNDVPTPPP